MDRSGVRNHPTPYETDGIQLDEAREERTRIKNRNKVWYTTRIGKVAS